jgi:extracellular factor (EF) 3-hydroxypalmitic acid methyl ester biosynthesis protein
VAIFNSYDDVRTARRKMQFNITCRFDNEPNFFQVFELSAHGFSFICPKESCSFQSYQSLEDVRIVNGEGLEIISGSGTIIHVTQLDSYFMQIGVYYTKKTLDRTITGKIRVPRHFPKIRLNVQLNEKTNESSKKLTGFIIDYTASTARIAFDQGPAGHIAVGAELAVEINADNKVLYDGRAHIIRKRDDSTEIIIRFLEELLDVARVETLSNVLQNRMVLSSAFESMAEYEAIEYEFKALICDWRLYLARLKRVLDQEEGKKLYRLSSEQETFLQGIEEKILANLRNYIDRLNSIADHLSEKESVTYKKYFRENLTGFIRTSPLAASIIDKDLGYAGDFETIKQFFQNPYAGESLFAKMMNKFIYSTDAVSAHQERIHYLYDELCSSYFQAEAGFSILVLGSGPAEELLSFIGKNVFEKPVTATLLDMDAFALADFSERLQYLPKENFMIELLNINILGILRRRIADPVKGKYPFCYCAGLFDYFSDGICKRFVKYLINHMTPGGSIIITNVHKSNHTRHFMDYAGGWEIIHRDEKQMEALIPPEHHTEIKFSKNHSNMYLKIHIAN